MKKKELVLTARTYSVNTTIFLTSDGNFVGSFDIYHNLDNLDTLDYEKEDEKVCIDSNISDIYEKILNQLDIYNPDGEYIIDKDKIQEIVNLITISVSAKLSDYFSAM